MLDFFPVEFISWSVLFWYSVDGGKTDVLLNCGRFYGPIVRPRMRMNEWMGEWMNEWKNNFLIFGNVEPTVEWYWQGETEGLGEKPVPVPRCPP
jgi:hypothetical protein